MNDTNDKNLPVGALKRVEIESTEKLRERIRLDKQSELEAQRAVELSGGAVRFWVRLNYWPMPDGAWCALYALAEMDRPPVENPRIAIGRI